MAIFGLGDEKQAPQPKVEKKNDKKIEKSANSQSDEAQAMLKKMKEKNDAGDCAFC